MKVTDVGAAYDAQFERVEMSDKLRVAAKAAYKAMIAAELSDGSKREWEAAVDGLKAALAEPAIKDSLTVQRPWVGLTDDEILRLYKEHAKYQEEGMKLSGWGKFAADVQAKLRDKNT